MANTIKQREYVNKELARLTKGKSITKTQRTKLMKSLWKQAKKKYK